MKVHATFGRRNDPLVALWGPVHFRRLAASGAGSTGALLLGNAWSPPALSCTAHEGGSERARNPMALDWAACGACGYPSGRQGDVANARCIAPLRPMSQEAQARGTQ